MADSTPSPSVANPYLVQNYNRNAVRFVRGSGCHLEDDRGKRYLDAFAGVAVSALGHGHPRLAQAIADQARTLIHTSNHYCIGRQEELAELIVTSAFPGRVMFCNSGAEANEIAYKAARLWGNLLHGGRKTRMLAFTNSFHGRTLGALSITQTPAYREPFAPLPPAEFLPFGDLAAFEKAIGDDVAAVFIEPIQGEAGVFVPPAGHLAAVRALCTRHGALLVFDEIQTGVGRTGRMFAHQHEGVIPDIMSMAKGLGGGVPIGAALMSESVAALFKPGMHGTTFGGNQLACAAGVAVLTEVGAPGFLANVVARSEQLQAGLRARFGATAVRGQGLLLGVQLTQPPGPLVRAALDAGLVVGPAGNNTLRIAPPLVITAPEVDDLLERLDVARKTLG